MTNSSQLFPSNSQIKSSSAPSAKAKATPTPPKPIPSISTTKNSKKTQKHKQAMEGAVSTRRSQNLETSLIPIPYQWEIEFARFFNFPRRPSYTAGSSLKPLPKSKYRCGGTWLASSTLARLRIMTDSSSPETILVVTLGDRILEEHFTCNLHFSWPQVSCVTECPTRGSRVVFASYKDCAGQIQKFALRFATSCDAQMFIDALKDNMKDGVSSELPRSDLETEFPRSDLETEFPRSHFGSDIASQSEFVPSNGLEYRAEEVNIFDPVATMPPLLNYTSNQSACAQEPLRSSNLEALCNDLPPSFTALLSTCAAEAELVLAKKPNEMDLKSQIMKYMSDSSFQDMLIKVEEVISEMGGDLTV